MWLARCYHLLISILHITKRICCSCFGSLVAKTWSQRRRRGVSSQQQTWVIGYLHINPHLLHFYSPFCFKAYSRFPFINFECRWTNLSRIHFTLLPRNWWPCNDFRSIHWIIITRISTTFYNCPPICHIGFSPLIITNERVLHNWKFKRTPLEFPKLANAQLLTLDT